MSTLKVDGIRSNSATSDAITLAGDGTCTANITNNLSNRNLIINGAMNVAQRGTSQTGVNSSGYKNACDRWYFNAEGANVGTYTVSQSTTSPDGFANSLKIDCTTARTPANNEIYEIVQRLEGQNLQGLAKGTSASKKLSLSFYVKTNVSGNYVVWLYDKDNARNIGAVYTVSNSNWNRYTVSFPADTTGAFDNDNDRSLDLRFVLLAGSNFTSGTLPTTAWESISDANSRVGQTANVASSTSNEWYLTGVQLEIDHTGSGVATDFEHRSYAQELALCQRYYYLHCSGDGKAISIGSIYTDNYVFNEVSFPVSMRANPSLDQVTGSNYYAHYSSGTADAFNQFVQINDPHLNGCMLSSNNAGGVANMSAGKAVHTITSNSASFLAFSAEL